MLQEYFLKISTFYDQYFELGVGELVSQSIRTWMFIYMHIKVPVIFKVAHFGECLPEMYSITSKTNMSVHFVLDQI